MSGVSHTPCRFTGEAVTTSNTALQLAEVIVNGASLGTTSTPDGLFDFNIQSSTERFAIRLNNTYRFDPIWFWDDVHVLSIAHGSTGERHTRITAELFTEGDTVTVDAASTTTLTTTLGNVVVPPATYYRHYSDATQYTVSIRKISFRYLKSRQCSNYQTHRYLRSYFWRFVIL